MQTKNKKKVKNYVSAGEASYEHRLRHDSKDSYMYC